MRARWVPLLAVAALLVAAAFASAWSSPQVTAVPVPNKHGGDPTAAAGAPQAPPPATAAPVRPPAADHTLPAWVGTVAAMLGIAVILVLLGLLARYLLRDTLRVRTAPLPPPVTQEPAAARTEDMVAALDEGLSGLDDRDTDARRAVIACWVRLEQTAAAAGTPRRPGDTPTDLVGRLLAAHQVSGPVLDDFAAVYREARYATHVVDERMRAAAVRSLGLLRAELTVGVH